MKRCAIIGAGISGLSTAYFLQKKSKELEIHVYEAEPVFGGVIKTEHIDGCIVEGGPDSFLTQKKFASQLCSEIGLGDSLVGSNDHSRKTFLFHDHRLKPLPEGFFLMVPTRILPFLTTDLMSWHGKFSALRDLFESPEQNDCTAGEFIEKRFGKEILHQIAEPLLAGVYGADINLLSLQAALPQIWELQKRGSMILSLLRARKTSQESLFTTLAGGMEMLPKTLKQHLPEVSWKSRVRVHNISNVKGMWKIGSEFYDLLVNASSSMPEIETDICRQIRHIYDSIVRNSAIVVVLCFEKINREGFGWLVPLNERRSVLACTYVSNKFPGRSPQGRFLVRLFFGGAQASAWLSRTEQEILQEALRELKRIAGVEEQPLFQRVFRWKNAMPEYRIGHAEKITSIQSLAANEKNLFLTGNLFQGVGIPDCIKHAENTAEAILKRI